MVFDFDDLVDMDDKPDFRSRTFTVSHTTTTPPWIKMVTSDFTASCGDYYLVGCHREPDYMVENNNNYWDAWSQAGTTTHTLRFYLTTATPRLTTGMRVGGWLA